MEQELKRWTAFIRWAFQPAAEEEIDVDAPDRATARLRVIEQLGHYEPGAIIDHILGPREGLYL